MTSPQEPRINRAALDRIIQRAAELQTGEHDVGDNLTPDEVLALGKEVGIPAKYLQQAMLEHRSAVEAEPERSLIGRVVGPAEVRAQRVVQGDAENVLQALQGWMDRNELMVLQRIQPGWASWEPLKGMQAAIRRGAASLDTSKPKFMLSRAEVVVATVTQLESGYTHITLTATLKATRRGHVTGSVVSTALGAGAGAVVLSLGIFSLLAAIPIGVGLLVSGVVARGYKPIADRVQLGLERALDYLERGGVKPAHELADRSPGLLDVLANEVRRALSPGSPPRRPSGPRPFPKDQK